MVPMHLGLTEGPFVPHNLTSAQESPVPSPSSRWPPRLKIFMSSGSKKGTWIYYPFLSKSNGKRIPSRFPSGAPMQRDTCLHGIFTAVLLHLFLSFSQSPRYGDPLHITWQDPHGQGYCVTRATGLFIHSFIHACMSAGVPKKEPSCIWGKTYGHRPLSPMQMEGLHTMGCSLVPQGDLQGSNSPRTMHPLFPVFFLDTLTLDDRTNRLHQNISQ